MPAISPPSLDWGGCNAADTDAAPIERAQPEYLRLPPPPPGAAGASLSALLPQLSQLPHCPNRPLAPIAPLPRSPPCHNRPDTLSLTLTP